MKSLVFRYMVSSKELGSGFHDKGPKKILARMAAIGAILSVSRECIGIMNIFYKTVFRSTPPSHGDTLILRSRDPMKSKNRSLSVLYLYCYCTVSVLYTDRIWDFTGSHDLKIDVSPRLGGAERKTFFIENVQYTYRFA